MLVLVTAGLWGWRLIERTLSPVPTLTQATVERKPLRHQVPVYGVLKPASVHHLTSTTEGRIEQILAKPGSNLNPGQPVLLLANPKLEREHQRAALALEEQQALLHQLELQQQAAAQQLVSDIRVQQAALKLQQHEHQARVTLANQGNLSSLELHRSLLALEKEQIQLQVLQQTQSVASLTNQAELTVARLRVEQAREQYAQLTQDIEGLVIRAGEGGTLNSLNDDLQAGNWIQSGINVGVMADNRQLYARLQVSASYAADLAMGQQVWLNIKGQWITANVSRISPKVEENRIELDAQLAVTLPAHARANLEINGTLILASLGEGLMIPKPANVRPDDTEVALFARSPESEQFTPVKARILHHADTWIQVESDQLKVNDKVLLDVPESMRHRAAIFLGEIRV
ncbi:HlyD family secretion protein [Ferrimonas sediminicola]|nr:HlyD family efflux transporter periplasmic adaptor subunit [Ferrimonas sediminicola]